MSKAKFNLSQVKAVIFDLGGVVLNLDYNLTIEAFKKLGEEKFENLYAQANQDEIFDKYEVGDISSSEFIQYLLQLLPASCAENDVIVAWNAMLLDLPARRINLIRDISTKMPVYLFSNTNDLHYKEFSRSVEKSFGRNDLLESTFKKCYFSHLVGERKPNSAAFEMVLNENQHKPNEVLFIDDSIQHIEGAQKLGLHTIHLTDSDICDILNFE